MTLTELVDQYVSERLSLGHITRRTADGYLAVLKQMARHVGDDITAVTAIDLRVWLTHSDRGGSVKPRTVALRCVISRQFFDWCVDADLLAKNPAKAIATPRVRATEPRYFEHDEVRRLTAVARAPRDRAMVLCMVQMGMRRIEVQRALVSDLRDGKLAVRGKGGDGEITRWLPIPTEAQSALDTWMKVRANKGDVLFCTSKGTKLIDTWISRKMSELMLEAGVKHAPGDGYSAHALRHSFAQHLVDADVPLRVVQKAMGHATVTTTESYLRRNVDVLAEALEGRTYVA